MMPFKTCTKCLKTFEANLQNFYKNGGGSFGLTPRCKQCVNEDNKRSHAKRMSRDPDRIKALATARTQRHYFKNLEASRQKQREYQATKRADPQKRAAINMAKRAGGARLTVEEFDAMFAAQGRCCAICQSTDPGAKNGWNIDHCHKSNKVRFILCAHCNRGLGAFFDNSAMMRKAANMLEKYQDQMDEPVSSIFAVGDT